MNGIVIKPELFAARELLLSNTGVMETEEAELSECAGRILAEAVTARFSVPPFERSPYDGYALIAADTKEASAEHPVTLRVLETVAAGAMAAHALTPGTAIRIMTGAKLPDGADAVVMYEKTRFTEQEVQIFAPCRPGENVVPVGEDLCEGALLAERGERIDVGTVGTIASQNICSVRVYKKPRVGIISTGTELLEPGEEPVPGKIYNTNRYTFMALMREAGYPATYLGSCKDEVDAIAKIISEGLKSFDVLILTGGVSAGDLDLTPLAMQQAGVRVLFHGVRMKPGMSCAYGTYGNKLVMALSGNPAAALTNYYALGAEALAKLSGITKERKFFEAALSEDFKNRSPVTRLLRGRLEITDGKAVFFYQQNQKNASLSSVKDTNAMAIIPAGSDSVPSGTMLQGFFL